MVVIFYIPPAMYIHPLKEGFVVCETYIVSDIEHNRETRFFIAPIMY